MIKRKIIAVATALSLLAPVAVAPASAYQFGDITRGFLRITGETFKATTEFFLGKNVVSDAIGAGLCLDDHNRLKKRLDRVARQGILSLDSSVPLKVTTRAGGFYPLAIPWVLSPAAKSAQSVTRDLNKNCNNVNIEIAPISDIIKYSTLTVEGHPWVSIGLNQSLVVTVPEGTDPNTYTIPVELTETTGYTVDGAPGEIHHKLTLEVKVEPGEPDLKNKARLTGSSDFFSIFSMFSS